MKNSISKSQRRTTKKLKYDVEGISLHLSEICITSAIESGESVTTLQLAGGVWFLFFAGQSFCRALCATQEPQSGII